MYRAYIYDDLEHFAATDLRVALLRISAARRDKTLQYIYESDRKQSVVAELLLMYALRDTFALAELPEICYGQHGKPMFKDSSLPHFNLSHCKIAVACVVSDDPAGIDVEPYSSYNEEVAREIFNEAELKKALGNPSAFAELWTMKESFLKYTGEGLTDSILALPSTNAGKVTFHTFHSPTGYACTVCTPNKSPLTSATVGNVNSFTPTIVDKTTLLDD